MKTGGFLLLTAAILIALPTAEAQDKTDSPIRIGIIGLDTSHVPAFTSLFNDPKNEGELAGFKVVAGFPGGSPDVPASFNRVEKFTREIQDKYGVEIVDSIDALLKKVDVVMIESVDGRPHLNQALPVLKAGKKLFIDKPIAGSLADAALLIFDLAKKHGTPTFSSSSLRFATNIRFLHNNPKLGKVLGCVSYSPCEIEKHHPDLFWYGVHSVPNRSTPSWVQAAKLSPTPTPRTPMSSPASGLMAASAAIAACAPAKKTTATSFSGTRATWLPPAS